MGGDRLDLGGFYVEPGSDPADQPNPGAMRVVEELGTTSWDFGPAYEPQAKAAYIQQLGAFRTEIREQVDVGRHSEPSVALVDWTSLDTTRQLLTADHDSLIDPFVALADLSAVIAALVFYDHVVALDPGHTARDVGALLGLDGVLHGVAPHSTEAGGDRMHLLLNAHFVDAVAEFDRATRVREPWLDTLESGWKRILPGVNFPSHKWDSFDTRLGYTASPDRKSGSNMVFEAVGGSYLMRADGQEIADAILDNDVRALFYERLASTLGYILRDGDRGPRVRYVGGCLRSPLRSALTQRASDYVGQGTRSSPAEGWLQQYWRDRYTTEQYPVRLPFWMGTLFERAHRLSGGKDRPADVLRAIRDLRKAADPLRRRKAAIETEIRRGSISIAETFGAALERDAAALTPSTEAVTIGGVEALGTAASIFIPAPAAGLLKAIAKAGASVSMPWIRRLSMRLFDPHLFFVFTATSDALEVRRALEAAFGIFRFRGGHAREPLAFMQAVNETAWFA
jgi:hypothetical protein